MQFPDSLPAPAVGLSIDQRGEHRSLQFDGGRRIVRQVRGRPNMLAAKWQVTDAQRQTLDAFHRSAGVAYFLISLPAPGGWTEQQARFTGQLSMNYRGVDWWECSAMLLLMRPTHLTPAQLEHELLYMLGDWQDLTFGDDLDTLTNTTLPTIYG
ncbi:hypothetical protein GCM10023116_43720 [Kistimonas scapharcae]|uniref:Phage tail protein n=1 Tax=Kistimonas scapharcae TaxID=1036133 RepID=A0ABP8V976_9GAMM